MRSYRSREETLEPIAVTSSAIGLLNETDVMISPNDQALAAETPLPVVLVTGSEGLIGSRLTSALASRYRVVGLDVDPSPHRGSHSTFIRCDLTQAASVENALGELVDRFGSHLASVIHLAAYYDFTGEPSVLYEQLTVEGTRRLLRQLRKLEVEQFVFSSSLLVMKPVEIGEWINENSATEASWDYPQSKLAAEQVIREERGTIPSVLLRIAGVYDEDGHSIPIGQQMARIHEKKIESYLFPGNSDHGQPYVHLDDLVACFLRVVERRAQFTGVDVILVAEPEIMSYRELQEHIGEGLHGREWPTIRIPKVMAKGGAWVKEKTAGEDRPSFIKPWMVDLADMHYPIDITRARKLLGWEPRNRLRGTLDEIIRRLRADPRRWYQLNGLAVPNELS